LRKNTFLEYFCLTLESFFDINGNTNQDPPSGVSVPSIQCVSKKVHVFFLIRFLATLLAFPGPAAGGRCTPWGLNQPQSGPDRRQPAEEPTPAPAVVPVLQCLAE
jgi:hypothetical protein